MFNIQDSHKLFMHILCSNILLINLYEDSQLYLIDGQTGEHLFCQLLQKKKKSVLLFLSIWSLPHVGRVTPASAPAS